MPPEGARGRCTAAGVEEAAVDPAVRPPQPRLGLEGREAAEAGRRRREGGGGGGG